LSSRQRHALVEQLPTPNEEQAVLAQIDAPERPRPTCPYCANKQSVKNGQANGLQRYKCRCCNKTFNALTGTPLARLRQRHKWRAQARVLDEGLSVHKASERLQVAPSTAFRWRQRFLRASHQLRPLQLNGITEADETFIMRSKKGQPVNGLTSRHRGDGSRTRGTSGDHVPVVVARDRSGGCAYFILARCSKRELFDALPPILAADAVLCSDGSSAMAADASQMGIEHHALNMTTGRRVRGPWQFQNVKAYHSRLKDRIRRFRGIATSYLNHYLGWFRSLDRYAPGHINAATLLDLSLRRVAIPS
jgi:transposase-like protein